MEKKKIIFIVNPISGTQSKDTIVELIKKHLDKEKYDFDIIPTQFAGHAIELAAIAAAENVFMVVAIGGDGTVNEVAVRSSTRTPPWASSRAAQATGSPATCKSPWTPKKRLTSSMKA